MTNRELSSVTRRFAVPTAALVAALALAHAAEPTPDTKPAPPELLRQMEGNWTVVQKMWPGRNMAAVDLPTATVRRRLIQQSFLEEVMESKPGSTDSFSRISNFLFNSTTHRFEYFSLDSRMPQMMNERSGIMNASIAPDERIQLDGSHFVAPSWGKQANVPFHYRLVVGGVEGDRQVVQLFLTPESGKDREEFMAFEYQYVRAR